MCQGLSKETAETAAPLGYLEESIAERSGLDMARAICQRGKGAEGEYCKEGRARGLAQTVI